jgi:catechol 2,3-dioxygenase-like lactoylglutathione lyase family enzyme
MAIDYKALVGKEVDCIFSPTGTMHSGIIKGYKQRGGKRLVVIDWQDGDVTDEPYANVQWPVAPTKKPATGGKKAPSGTASAATKVGPKAEQPAPPVPTALPLKKGMKVRAFYAQDQNWYDAIIEAILPNGIQIKYTDDGIVEVVAPNFIMVPGAGTMPTEETLLDGFDDDSASTETAKVEPIVKGQDVFVLDPSTGEEYPGSVQEIYGNGNFKIMNYNDGTSKSGITPDNVRSPQKGEIANPYAKFLNGTSIHEMRFITSLMSKNQVQKLNKACEEAMNAAE